MTSFTDLFNPTFLMFLGILVLVVALLVVYFESKMREQNHKIASMISLVSTLAEDMNGVKMGLNHLAMTGGNIPNIFVKENLGNSDTNKLIEVSDGEETIYEELDEEESNVQIDDELDEEVSDDSDDDDNEVKVIKLQVSNEDSEDNNLYEEADNLEFEQVDDLDELNNDELNNDEIPDMADNYIEEILSLKYDDKVIDNKDLEETTNHSTSEMKTITLDLGDNDNEKIEYKKLPLVRLRSIAVEKGLATNLESSKLKKPELLKLLDAE